MTHDELLTRIRAMKTEVSRYTLRCISGCHIRQATQVLFEDGGVVRFIERLPKYKAVAQAVEYRAKEAEYGRKLPTLAKGADR